MHEAVSSTSVGFSRGKQFIGESLLLEIWVIFEDGRLSPPTISGLIMALIAHRCRCYICIMCLSASTGQHLYVFSWYVCGRVTIHLVCRSDINLAKITYQDCQMLPTSYLYLVFLTQYSNSEFAFHAKYDTITSHLITAVKVNYSVRTTNQKKKKTKPSMYEYILVL